MNQFSHRLVDDQKFIDSLTPPVAGPLALLASNRPIEGDFGMRSPIEKNIFKGVLGKLIRLSAGGTEDSDKSLRHDAQHRGGRQIRFDPDIAKTSDRFRRTVG